MRRIVVVLVAALAVACGPKSAGTGSAGTTGLASTGSSGGSASTSAGATSSGSGSASTSAGGTSGSSTCIPACGSAKVCVSGSCVDELAALAFAQPLPHQGVGDAGADVEVHLTLAAASVQPPASIALGDLEGRSQQLALGAQASTDVTYSGHYQLAPDAGASDLLTARVGNLSASLPIDVDFDPPSISSTQAQVDTGLRDGTLTVSATVLDPHLQRVWATLDLDDGGVPIELTGDAGSVSGSVSLQAYPFPFLSGGVTATVHAVDSAGNTATDVAGASATRAVSISGGGNLQPQMVAARDGSVFVLTEGVPNSPLVATLADGGSWIAQLGSVQTTDAMVATPGALFVPSYGLSIFDPGTGQPLSACTSYGTVAWSSATGVAYSTNGKSAVAYLDGGCRTNNFSLGSSVSSAYGPAIAPDGSLYLEVSISSLASVVRLVDDGGAVAPVWSATLERGTPDGLAVDAAGNAIALVTVAADAGTDVEAAVYRVDPQGNVTRVGSSGFGYNFWTDTGPVIGADGDIFFCGANGRERRLHADGSDAGLVTNSGTDCRHLVLVQPDRSGVAMYAAGNTEPVLALDANGQLVWSSGVYANTAPVIGPGPDGGMPRLYVGTQDGHVSAFIVDTGLDPRSPWPRLHHDAQNTWDSRAPLP